MARQTCSACRKVIEVEPPVCPACGAEQPERAAGAWARALVRLSAAATCALVAGAFTYSRRAPRFIEASRSQGPGAGAVRLQERIAPLKADAAYPLTFIEDAMADPASFADKRASVVLKRIGRQDGGKLTVQGVGPLTTFQLKAANAAVVPLPKDDRQEWLVARGTWRRREPGEQPLLLEAESVEPLGDAQNEEIAAILGVGFQP